MIADEIDFSLRPRERQMIGGVARRRHRLQRPAIALDGLAVAHPHIGIEIAVGAGFRIVLLALIARPRRPVRAFGIDGGTGRGLQPRGVRGMVAMGVGDQNMRHGFPAHGVQQRRRMGLVVGTGIDDRDLALAHDVTHRAREGERARIVAEDTPHPGADFLDHARRQRKVAIERDVVVIGHGSYLLLPIRHARARVSANPESTSCSSTSSTCRIAGFADMTNSSAARNDGVESYENA